MIAPPSIRHDLVLVGGGHAHVAVLKHFGMRPLPGLRLTLVSPDASTPYSGMLPGLVAGHYRPDETHVELRPLCRFAQAQFIQAPIAGLDLDRRHILFANRPPIAFETLSLNTGSTPRLDAIPGAALHGIPVKPVDRFLSHWRQQLQERTQRPPADPPSGSRRVVVVGGGAGGVELLLALRHRLLADQVGPSGIPFLPEFHLVTASAVPLPTHAPATQRLMARTLAEQGIVVHVDRRVAEVQPGELVCTGGQRIAFDVLFWATQAGPPSWLNGSGLATDPDGFIAVHPTLQSVSHPFVFAAGDVASVLAHPRPKSGVFAVRQGLPLAENLRRASAGVALKPFIPQSRALNLISAGDRRAILSYGPAALSGRWVWRLKDWIDRRWMRLYQDLPSMTASAPSEPLPCGGCAAKVPSAVLSRVLRRLRPISRPGILMGLEAPDDAAAFHVPEGSVLVQTVDVFRSFLNDPHVFGRIAAHHGLNDLFAKGAEPHSALAMATIPFGSPGAVEETLFQVLSGALEVLNENNAALMGGHSAEGPELAFGLSLNGLAAEDRLLRKSGLRSGDVLILTKALGTGTLFAADMLGQAEGRWIEGAVRSMLVSGGAASLCLRRHGATACTDVSGFGLMGHLLEMLRASRRSASLDLASLPALDGALESLHRGHFSSLHDQNLQARSCLSGNGHPAESHERFHLLFDPQTSGGLLAGIPAENAARCLEDLQLAGYPAARIVGAVDDPCDGEPSIRFQRHE